MREDKETTKVRIVYYSVAIYGGISYNSMLPGPKLSKMFFYALLRFRSYLVAMVADLTEIFSQVTMARKDGGYHPFLWGWRLHLSRLAEVYEAMRLMFSDRASLYLAQYVVRQHAKDNRNDHPLTIATILLQVYVDEIMTSLSTNDEAIKAREYLRESLGKAGFKMRSGGNNIAEKIVVTHLFIQCRRVAVGMSRCNLRWAQI